MIGLGIAALTDAAAQNNSIEGEFGNEFSSHYRENNQQQQMAGVSLIGGGLIFFIIGVILVATKTKAQRKKEAELKMLKKQQTNNATQSGQTIIVPKDNSLTQKSTEEIFGQLEKLGKLREQGILTEEEFQIQKKKLLET